MQVDWRGVFPAATTQFKSDLSIDIGETQRVQDALVNDGVHGLIIMGTVGENNSLEPDEKRDVLRAAVEAVNKRVPVIAGVSEFDTNRAIAFARDAEKVGADGLMLLPAMVYVPAEAELVAHFKAVAKETALPIMLYNNPPAYRVSVGIEAFKQLADVPNIVCLKESAPDTRRFTDLYNAVGDKIMLFAGLDDVALEGLILGAKGWVSGLTNAFPKELLELYNAYKRGDLETALAIYRWFMPLLHLDAEHDLVQSIKLAEQIMGRGSERVRPPRYTLTGARRAEVTAMVEQAAATRPKLEERRVTRHTFRCIDGHTAGNPVRLVIEGKPDLSGASMSERRQEFMARYDWIRTGLCFEPRGHDMMSGGFLYPPTTSDADVGILFIETSGCLPMCGRTIGIVTFGIESGLIKPRTPGRFIAEVPAGRIELTYTQEGDRVRSVRIRNVPSYLAAQNVSIDVPGFGPLTLDIAYGGNFYAIIEPQGAYTGLDGLRAARILQLSPIIRQLVRDKIEPVHPVDSTIRGVSHVLWADKPKGKGAHGRNAVFYGDKAIDRSPCGTGTSARLAHLHAKGKLKVGDAFVHESYILSRFVGRVEAETELGGKPAIIPSIEGSAIATGRNEIWIDTEDTFAHGFQVV